METAQNQEKISYIAPYISAAAGLMVASGLITIQILGANGIQIFGMNTNPYAQLYRHVKKLEKDGLVAELGDGTRFEASNGDLKVIIPNVCYIVDNDANGLRESEELRKLDNEKRAKIQALYDNAVRKGLEGLVNK